MNAHHLTKLYDDWKTATRAEQQAILERRWHDLPAYQAHKQSLQQAIIHTTDAWRQNWPRTGESDADYNTRFRPILTELIMMESANLALLDESKEAAQEELTTLDRTTSALRGVHRAYGSPQAAQWASYS